MPITLNGDNGITTPLDIEIQGSTSGSITLAAPAVAGSSVITFPTGTGIASVNGLSSNIVSGTSVASTSGTSINFTGIPSWVKRITVMFSGVSTNGISPYLLQIGSGSVQVTGYVSSGSNLDPASVVNASGSTAGMRICNTNGATVVIGGQLTLNNLGSNIWTGSGVFARADNAGSQFLFSGYVTLSGVLDRVRITTINGTDTFDAGTINLLYE